ncbi:MAG TPA: hypothetical protein VK859_02375, partial [bacterium]|nr:hypothetical protein [bacterium]
MRYSLGVGAPDPVNDYYGIAASETATFLIFPWYLLGSLERSLNPFPKAINGNPFFGPRTTLGVVIAVLPFYFLEGLRLFGQWRVYQASYFFGGKFLPLLLALFSVGLVRLQKGERFTRWGRLYTQVISGFSILFLFLILILKNNYSTRDGVWSDLDFYGFFTLEWFIGVFMFFIFRRDGGWARPALALWMLTALTLGGPLNPSSLSKQEHANALKKELSEAGLLKDGFLVKPAALPDRSIFGPVQNNLYWFSQNGGLNWMRESFPPEFRVLDWNKEKSPSLLPGLLEWMGQPQVKINNPPVETFSIKAASPWTRQLGNEVLQDFNIREGEVVPYRNQDGYFFCFPKLTQFLMVFHEGQLLGQIPLEGLAQKLEKYDGNGGLRSGVRPRDMFLEL